MLKILTMSLTLRRTMFSMLVALVAPAPGPLQVRDHDAAWTAPIAHSSRLNPLASRLDVVAGGAKIFQQRCTTCHGEDGRGTTKAPDLTRPDVQAQTDGALFWKISSGNTHQGMPTFSFLPEPQRWQLVLQLRALATTPPPAH